MGNEEIKRVSEELEKLLDIYLDSDRKSSGNPDPEVMSDVWVALGDVSETYFSDMLPVEYVREPARERREPDGLYRQPEPRQRKSRKKKKGLAWAIWPAELIERYFKPSDGLWAAFCVPVLVMIVVFIQRGIFPFGEQSFLRTDMYHQYAPFFSEFQHKLSQGGSLLYSWDIGMGVNFSALYAYYLASPLNWFLVLCPKGLVIEFMTYSIVLKIGLSGLSFAWYLRKHCDRDDFGVGFFGIFYALSGYMAAYSWNIMWLDCILLFPLIMLGLERLVEEKKGLLYGVTLGVSILSNYYISIMTCIFMVIYFIALLILKAGEGRSPRDYWANIGQFSLYSLLAGGVAAGVLIPEIYALQMTASAESTFPKTISSYFSIFDMFARHIGNVDTEIGLDHWPNIYCGVAVLLFFLLYLSCRQIKLKEKAVYCGLMLLFFASFSVNALNFIWHGFHFPNSLPCRQSFIYIFLMLAVCYRAYMNLSATPWKDMVIAFWGAVAFVILAEKLVEQDHFEFYVYYVAVLFLALYGGLLYLYKRGRVNYGVLMALTLAVVSVEAAVNTTVTSVTTTSRTSYIRDNEDVRELTQSLVPSDSFYRIEKVTRKTKNDGAWMNFPSVSLFSSTANADLTDFFKTVGCEGNTNAYSITGSTPLVDSLFSVKYGLYSSEQTDNELLEKVDRSGDTWLYRRLYTLPVGFLVSDSLDRDWQRDLGNPAEVQNSLCAAVGADRVLIEKDGENLKTGFRLTPDESGDYYVYIANKKVKEVKVKIGGSSQTFKNVNRGFLLELGQCTADVEIEITNEDGDDSLNARAYRFSGQGLQSVYDRLNRHPFKVLKWKDTEVEGEIEADRAGVLFTSIPYDKGWTVKVDGVEQETRKIFDAFLSVDVPEGHHRISMSYEPEGLRLGLAVSGVCVLCLVLLGWAGRRGRKRRERRQAEEEVLFLRVRDERRRQKQ
ncbi:MAG: YfhO family protein [Hungatella sp.]|nr:YfhO family protein [Hungatella sp.]